MTKEIPQSKEIQMNPVQFARYKAQQLGCAFYKMAHKERTAYVSVVRDHPKPGTLTEWTRIRTIVMYTATDQEIADQIEYMEMRDMINSLDDSDTTTNDNAGNGII